MDHPLSTEETIFVAAIALSAAERDAFIERTCAADPALAARVRALISAHENARSLLHSSPGALLGSTAVVPGPAEQPGMEIDRYKLLQKIGEGGCGVVYMAEQQEPVRRRVALCGASKRTATEGTRPRAPSPSTFSAFVTTSRSALGRRASPTAPGNSFAATR